MTSRVGARNRVPHGKYGWTTMRSRYEWVYHDAVCSQITLCNLVDNRIVEGNLGIGCVATELSLLSGWLVTCCRVRCMLRSCMTWSTCTTRFTCTTWSTCTLLLWTRWSNLDSTTATELTSCTAPRTSSSTVRGLNSTCGSSFLVVYSQRVANVLVTCCSPNFIVASS